MKHLLGLIIVVLLQVSCSKDSEWEDPLSLTEKAMLESQMEALDRKGVSDVLYKQMAELSQETAKWSNAETVKALPNFKKSYALFKEPENYPVLFYFILYDKRCKSEIESNARFLLWEVAKNNYGEVAEQRKEELMEQGINVDGVEIIRPEVLREYDIKLIKGLLPYFE